MVTAGDFRNGMTIQMDGSIWQVIEFQHVKPGKGSPFVRTKLKNIINGGVVENSYNPTAKFDLAHIDKSEYQYLYADDDFYHFMNTENYEQIQLTKETGRVILLSSLRRTRWLSFSLITEMYSLSSHLFSLSL